MAIKNTNPRIGTFANLPSGGTYDLLMITYPDGFPEGQIQFNIDSTPRKITGVQKAAQLFVKILMTTKGSDVVYPNRGTLFSSFTVGANVIVDDPILQSNLASAVSDATSQTRIALSSDPDPSSRLTNVQLAGFNATDDAITMFVQLTTASGVSAQVAIPFPQLGLV
jgi:hypothetical protein